jgi:hypothetical protein
MTELTALEWAGAYLGLGACALLLMRAYVKWVVRPPQESEFVTEMMAAVRAGQPTDWRKRAESVLFVPLAVLVWPLSVGVGISELRKPAKTYREPPPEEKFLCQKEHLRMVTSPPEAERLGVVTDPLGRAPALPFGHLNEAWLTFLRKNEEGFSLWYFEVPAENARVRHERACRGFAWVKARKVQAEFVFETN